MTIQDERLNDIVFDKQKLVIQLDRGIIEQDKYDTEMKELNDKGHVLQKELMEKFKEDSTEQDVELEKVKFNLRVKRTNPNSFTSLIINALMDETIGTVDAVADQANEKKPGRDLSKIKTQTKTIIGLVKKQEGRWQQYNWNETDFMLTLKM